MSRKTYNPILARADSNANLNLHAYQAHKIFNFPCAYIELQYFVLNFVLIIS